MTEREETERSVQMSRTTSLMDEYADKKFIRKKDRRKNPGRTAGRNAVLYLGLGALLLAGIPVQAAQETYTNTDFAMDTVVSETLYTSGEDITPEIGSLLREIEETYLSWTDGDSEVAKITQAQGKPVRISETLAGYLQEILKLSEDSGGALDPTMGKVIRLWDIGGGNAGIPDEGELRSLLAETGYENLILDGDEAALQSGSLDLGAVGKGIGCDAVMEFLEGQEDVSGMLTNLGGSSVMVYGEKPDGSPWRVAVRDPRDDESGYLGALTLKGGEFLSTSGDYEKYFIEDGKRYHHILDPETGYPAWSGLTSVTVVCGSGLLADGLSTACFVLGREDALPLLEKYGAEAVFVDEDHNVYLTDGMKERFELLKNTYTIQETAG